MVPTIVFEIRYTLYRWQCIDLQKVKENAFRRGAGGLPRYGRNKIRRLLAFFQILQKFFGNFCLTIVFQIRWTLYYIQLRKFWGRYIRNILDAKPSDSKLTDAQFVLKVIEVGLRNIRTKEMSLSEGFALYFKSKQHLRPDSIRDIRCIGNRLLRTKPELAKRNFSELSVSECEEWITSAFSTPSQHNKARAMLHGLFEFAVRREWCDRNPIKRIERRKVVEKEIKPLKLFQIRRLIKTARRESPVHAIVAALLVYTGIRPREIRRLTWRDIDTEEKTITVRSQCSKTGGVRQVEIPPVLGRILGEPCEQSEGVNVCPSNWQRRWRKIRDNSGFRGCWVQDVLRHTYASFHTKRYADLPRLQVNMGHRDTSLLRARYVNMCGISRAEADYFFN